MSQQQFWMLVTFLGYSFYSALIGKVLAFAPSSVVLAIYMTTTAIVSWTFVVQSGQMKAVARLSLLEFAAIIGIGLIVFVSDFAFTKLFHLKVPEAVIYGLIAWIAVGVMVLFSLFGWRWPTWQQMVGVAICCYGAYVINTGKFGPP
jgi:hypothetical protein